MSRKTFLVFLCMALSAYSLENACKKANSNTVIPLSAKADRENLDSLISLRRGLDSWALRCQGSVSKERCDIGDAALFNGLLCLSGDSLSCQAVKKSQGADGRMWRSELRVASDAVDSFSRDMAMGVLAYLIATKDLDLANRWMSWIEGNEWRLCEKSTDNRCDFSPGFWTLFRDVWTYLGLPLNQKMISTVLDDSLLALLQSQFSPEGFELHLSAVNLLIRRSMGQKNSTLDAIADALSTRQTSNPFFSYLSSGISDQTLEKLYKWCPAIQPAERAEWSFERRESNRPWERSMGWECVMLVNLMLKDLNANNAFQFDVKSGFR